MKTGVIANMTYTIIYTIISSLILLSYTFFTTLGFIPYLITIVALYIVLLLNFNYLADIGRKRVLSD